LYTRPYRAFRTTVQEYGTFYDLLNHVVLLGWGRGGVGPSSRPAEGYDEVELHERADPNVPCGYSRLGCIRSELGVEDLLEQGQVEAIRYSRS
jgi:hypothetical protein